MVLRRVVGRARRENIRAVFALLDGHHVLPSNALSPAILVSEDFFWVSVLAGVRLRRGEGGEEWRGKKDTGYLYKAFMVARVALSPERM